jgi:hypothetical protein
VPVVDANSIFYLVEGAIWRAEVLYPGASRSDLLPHIIAELDDCLKTVRSCCSLDGEIHISERVFNEVSLHDRSDLERKGLERLRGFTGRQRGTMRELLSAHLGLPTVVSQADVDALRGGFRDRTVRPHDADGSLIVLACQLSAEGNPVVIVTSDPDLFAAVGQLVESDYVRLAGSVDLPTGQVRCRHYFNFVRRLHDCCNLASEVYEVVGNSYIISQMERMPSLRRQATTRRVRTELRQVLAVHTTALQHKCAVA